jgi:hypothetical protein
MTSTSSTITLAAWQITESRRAMFDVRSAYVEQCWLPILGPSTLLFLRCVARMLDENPEGVEVDAGDLARALGLSGRSGDRAPFRRMLDRASDFRMIHKEESGSIAVRRHLPELSSRQLLRVSAIARTAHDSLRSRSTPASPAIEHARRLARVLAALGETPTEIERQLRHWHFSPATASLSAVSAEISDLSVRPSVDAGNDDSTRRHPRSSATIVPGEMSH